LKLEQAKAVMPIVESHVHIWTQDENYPFSPTLPDVPVPQSNATAEMLLAETEQAGVDHVVMVQPSTYGWDNRYLADSIARYPQRLAGVCLVNPLDHEAPAQLEYWVKERGFHGVRLHAVRPDSGEWFTTAQTDRIWRKSADLEIPVCILMDLDHAPLVAEMAQRFPSVDVVIDHMGRINVNEIAPYPKFSQLLRLADLPRTNAKVSGMLHYSNDQYPFTDTHPFFAMAKDAWGPQRLMWGTDWPMLTEKAGYLPRLTAVRDEMPFFSQDDLEWVLGGTALRLWKFPH
jgi:predicted TIM-barrel fold metal-dependent hydrolase